MALKERSFIKKINYQDKKKTMITPESSPLSLTTLSSSLVLSCSSPLILSSSTPSPTQLHDSAVTLDQTDTFKLQYLLEKIESSCILDLPLSETERSEIAFSLRNNAEQQNDPQNIWSILQEFFQKTDFVSRSILCHFLKILFSVPILTLKIFDSITCEFSNKLFPRIWMDEKKNQVEIQLISQGKPYIDLNQSIATRFRYETKRKTIYKKHIAGTGSISYLYKKNKILSPVGSLCELGLIYKQLETFEHTRLRKRLIKLEINDPECQKSA